MQKTSEVTAMEINNLFSSIKNNADKIGAIMGFVYDQNFSVNIMDIFWQASHGNIHLPDMGTVINRLIAEKGTSIAMTYLAGYILDEVKLPIVGGYGEALKKAAIGYAAGATAGLILWHSTHSETVPSPFNGGQGNGGGSQPGYGY